MRLTNPSTRPSFITGWPGELPTANAEAHALESRPIAQPHYLLRLVLYILRAQLSLRVSLAKDYSQPFSQPMVRPCHMAGRAADTSHLLSMQAALITT